MNKHLLILIVFLSLSLFELSAQINSSHYSYDATEMNNTIKFNVVKWNVNYSCAYFDRWFSEKPGLVTDGMSWLSGNNEDWGYYTFHRFNQGSYTCNYVRTRVTKGDDGYGANTNVSKRDAPYSSLKRVGDYYVLDLRSFDGYVPLYLPYSTEHNKTVWKKGSLVFEWIDDGSNVASTLSPSGNRSQTSAQHLDSSQQVSSQGLSGVPEWVFNYDWLLDRGIASITYHFDRPTNDTKRCQFTTISKFGQDQTIDSGHYTYSDGRFMLFFETSNSITTPLQIDYDKECLVVMLENTMPLPCTRIARITTSLYSGTTNNDDSFDGVWVSDAGSYVFKLYKDETAEIKFGYFEYKTHWTVEDGVIFIGGTGNLKALIIKPNGDLFTLSRDNELSQVTKINYSRVNGITDTGVGIRMHKQ